MNRGIQLKEGRLFIERVPAEKLAREFGTPLYAYAGGAIAERFVALRAGLGSKNLACFAVKANGNLSILRSLAGSGGADVVSLGELQRAKAAGFAPNKIVFSGVGKTAEELRAALELGILQINVESVEEFRLLKQIASDIKKRAGVAFRINPGVSAGGHKHIRTGRRGDKFGMKESEALQLAAKAHADPNFQFMGLSVHLGSQITDGELFEKGWSKLAKAAEKLRRQGIATPNLDGGGGLGINHDLKEWAERAVAILSKHCRRLILEPGRAVVASEGVLLTRVIRRKTGGGKNWLIVDAGMNNLLRPSLYAAEHPIVPAEPLPSPTKEGEKGETFAVAGPICESGDILAKSLELPPPPNGWLMAILQAGAYGSVMGSAYNARPLSAEVLVNGEDYARVRQAINAETMMKFEPIAPWLRRT